jgi:hypothetical protein
MAGNSGLRLPGGFGGITRFDEEYMSKFMITPGMVIGFIIGLIILVMGMRLFFSS